MICLTLENEFSIPVTVNNNAYCFILGEQKKGETIE